MEKVVNENGELVLKRTEFMQWCMSSAYHQVAIIAIANGSLDGAMEQSVSDFLKSLYKSRPLHRPKILELLKETGVDGITSYTFEKAGQLIVSSKIEESPE